MFSDRVRNSHPKRYILNILHLLMWVMFFSLWLPSYCSLFTNTRCKVLGMLVVLMFIPIYEHIIWGLAIARLIF
ncbi:hypothetical protein HanRHA438_Chr16g0757051 [Helianthus annuus]|nr:hypothetical protein HanOQP8_Chr16g0614131 [Helianthus annuus]KAJ0820985.1 hypothetical protein HanPSC8_Chr16g0714631 [Helianthus annuus]KAJ0835588.1 hypothetical protein HanRHA438_Chr16g0757051 [Helianthus annuus]